MEIPGATYQQEWERLAAYLQATYPAIQKVYAVDAALWLLQHLKRIDESGVLPAITDDGQMIRTVRDQWAVEQMGKSAGTDE